MTLLMYFCFGGGGGVNAKREWNARLLTLNWCASKKEWEAFCPKERTRGKVKVTMVSGTSATGGCSSNILWGFS